MIELVASLHVEWRGPAITKSVMSAISKRVKKAGLDLQRGVINTVSVPLDPNGTGTRAKAGQPPRAELGNLKRSILFRMVDQMTAAVYVDGPAQRRAMTLEFGGTIHPKTAKALAVPLSPEARRYRGPAREFRPKGQDLVPIYRAGKPTLLVEKHGKGGGEQRKKWTIHYVLLNSVRIQPHPFLRPTLARMAGQLARDIGAPLTAEDGFTKQARFEATVFGAGMKQSRGVTFEVK